MEMERSAHLWNGQVLLAALQGLMALRAKIFKLRVALRQDIALNNTCIPQASYFSASRAIDICFCDGGSSGSKNIFLHSRHLPFFCSLVTTKPQRLEASSVYYALLYTKCNGNAMQTASIRWIANRVSGETFLIMSWATQKCKGMFPARKVCCFLAIVLLCFYLDHGSS
jgi:hypothetical protein